MDGCSFQSRSVLSSPERSKSLQDYYKNARVQIPFNLLLGLPRELRDMIYGHLFRDVDELCEKPDPKRDVRLERGSIWDYRALKSRRWRTFLYRDPDSLQTTECRGFLDSLG